MSEALAGASRPPDTGKTEFFEEENPAAGAAVPPLVSDVDRWREKTRAALAGGLTVLLAVVLLLIVGAAVLHDYPTAEANELLCSLLAPLVGLVGAATGFYYGGGKH